RTPLAEPEAADAVALLRAHLAGDEATIEMLLSMVDMRGLFAITVEMLVGLLREAGVSGEQLEEMLAGWQARGGC
ncbi:MAG: hypothetical protein ACRDQV_18230, partial [Pseudonocardiaceae bacterium]